MFFVFKVVVIFFMMFIYEVFGIYGFIIEGWRVLLLCWDLLKILIFDYLGYVGEIYRDLVVIGNC